MKRLSSILVAIAVALQGLAGIDGQWTGTLKVPQANLELKLNFNFGTDDNGAATCTLDSPDQNAFGIPCNSVSISDSSVSVEVSSLRASFTGTPQGDSIAGTFKQGVASMPLTLRRSISPMKPKERAQTPQPPFPYTVREVAITNIADGLTLAGTLTMTENAKNVPAVVMITGSGAQNRDEELFGHHPFAVIADHLTRCGFAVLRYDDRGTAKSSGNFAKATTKDFARDAKAAFDFLASIPEINKKKIGYLGHSEGGQIALINASTDSRVAFIVTLAAPAIKGRDLILRQNEMIFEASSGMRIPDDALAKVTQMLDAIDRSTNADALRKELESTLGLSDVPEAQQAMVRQQIETSVSPWYTNFIKYDPTEAIKAVKCPIFALGGTFDVQVDADTNLGAIKALSGSKRVETKSYPGLNHLFQHCASAMEGLNYGKIEETIAPEVLDDIARWLKTSTK